MKRRIGKPVFFIVAAFIILFSYFAFCGFKTKYGDNDTTWIKGASDIRWGIDIRGGVDVTFKPADNINATDEQMDAAQSVIENRLTANNITDHELYVDYAKDRIIVRFPWKSDEKDFDAQAAVQELGSTAQLIFREGSESTGTVVLEGKHVDTAKYAFDQQTNQSVVSLTLTTEGTSKFSEATGRLKGQTISIWMDDTLLSAPTVNEQITDGKAIISGNFDAKSATKLANQIQSGSLPFKLEVESQGAISPTMGIAARDAMLLAGVIAFALVCLFMLLYYRLPGFVACIALTGMVAGSIAAVSGFFGFLESFTLTLPGRSEERR